MGHASLEARRAADADTPNVAIAVVGMGCWYPGANSPVLLWENVLAQRAEFRRHPDCRLPISEYCDPDPRAVDKTYGTRAAFIDGFTFDSAAARIPKSTYASTDMVHWLALDVARRAIEDAGYTRQNIPREKTGVIVGNILTGDGARACSLRLRWPYVRRVLRSALSALPEELREGFLIKVEQQYKSVFPAMTPDSLAGALANTIAGRICNFFDLHGGGYLVDGACASSLLAVTTAADALVRGDLDLAIAGGVDISIDPFDMIGFAQVGALTKGTMRVFDRRGDGFLPGEGAGFVVLKRLADARAAGDHVYAAIRGWGVSSDGRGGMMTPSPKGQALALRRAYEKAGFRATELDFVEGHGTGTAVGDRTELEAIALMFQEAGGAAARRCGVTSLKSLIGHTKAAAGVGALIKAVTAVNRRVLPPTHNCDEPNEVFDDLARTLYPIRTGELVAADRTLRAGVSAMGFGGINTHVTLESADPPSARLAPALDERALTTSRQASELLVLGADDVSGLWRRLDELLEDAAGMSDGELPDLAHKLSTELPADPQVRAAMIVTSPEDVAHLSSVIRAAATESAFADGDVVHSARGDWWLGVKQASPRLGFVFPGQGSQYPSMARMLVQRHGWARELVERADRWISEAGGQPVSLHLLRNLDRASSREELDAWKRELSQTQVAQPALCVTSLLWCKLLEQLGIQPSIVGGHSLGELVALYAAGAIDEERLIKIAVLRGRVMAAAPDRAGAMVSLACSRASAEPLMARVSGYLAVANVNAPRQTVVSGEREAIQALIQLAESEGVITQPLPVSNAFHSRLVEAASRAVAAAEVIPANVEALALPLVSGVRGDTLQGAFALRHYLAQQLLEPVDFVALVRRMSEHVDALVEVGPGRVLSGLTRDILGNDGPPCFPVGAGARADRDLNAMVGWIYAHGGRIDWEVFYRNRLIRTFVPARQRQFLDSPCERPLPPFEGPVLTGGSSELQVLTGSAGLSAEQLASYLRTRGEFLGEVIRADRRLLPDLANVQPATVSAGATAVAPPALSVAPPGGATSTARARLDLLLVETAVTLTGYPADTVSTQSRIIDDLNLDSIKVRELVIEAVQAAGLAAVIDRGKLEGRPLANATLGELAQAIAEACGEEGSAALDASDGDRAASSAASSPPAAPQAPSWVRNFAIEYEVEERGAKPDVQWQGARLLLAAESADGELVESLAAHFSRLGAEVKRAAFEHGKPTERFAPDAQTTHIVCLLPRCAPAPAADAASKLRRAVRRLCSYTALAPQGTAAQKTTLTFVQFAGGMGTLSTPEADLESCNVISFARSFKLESGPLRVRVVDLASSLPVTAVSEELVLELSLESPAFCVAAIDEHRTRRVPRARQQSPANYRDRKVEWSPSDVVLVTAGGKGITAECALQLAAETKARFALVGTSPVPDPAADANSELSQTLHRFQQAGVEHRYYSCDVSDAEAAKELVRAVRADLGPIVVIVHGAGLNIPRRTEHVSEDQACAEVAPKLLGIQNLLAATADAPPRLLVALTSCIGLTGMQGNAWYAFSNEMLDHITRRFAAEHPDREAVSVAFGLWGDAGMGARMGLLKNLASMGIGVISSAEGAHRFAELALRDPGTPQVMVTAFLGRLDEWLHAPAPVFEARFVDNVREYKAGVSLVCRTTLTLERDLYLNDHVYQGTVVFPGVLALEAMAQASAFALGVERPSFVCCEDIVFGRAIVVDPKRGAEIELRALVEELSVDGTQRIRTAIRAAESGYQVDCVQAVFVTGRLAAGEVTEIAVDEPLGVEPLRDVYGPILFHGPAYQRIREVYSLDSETAVAAVEISEASALGQGVFGEAEPKTLLLGDPFFRDATWQVGQMSDPRKLCLPLGIRALEFYVPAPYDAGRYVTSRKVGERDREFFGSGQVTDRQGRVLERVTKFHVRVMQDRPDAPSAEQLASTPRRTTARQIELARSPADVERMLRRFGGGAPALWWVHDPSLADKRGNERRQAEQSHLECALERYARHNTLPSKSVAIIWVASERPELLGMDLTSLDACYDGEYFLCAIGLGIQACDLRPVVERSEDAWMELLGQTRASVVLELLDDVENHHRIATRVQAAHEAARAAAHSDDIQIHNGRREGALLLFDAVTPEGGMVIATIPMRLGENDAEHVCAVIVERDAKIAGGRREARLYVDPEAYRTRMTLDGPERQPVLEHRTVVSFNEAASLSRTVLFPQYAFWMGKLREQSTYNVNTELMEQLTSGEWGMVTNRAEIRVFNELLGGDVVQARIWASEVVRSSVTMACEFQRVAAEGRLEPVAFGEQQITWVRFGGHGDASSAEFPAYMQRLIKLAGPRVPHQRGELYTRERLIARGATLYRRPGVTKHVIHTDELQTTLEDANLVGNIYFANYFNWQLRCRDMLSHAVAPSYLRGTGSRGEWGCLRAKMTYLRDGMPFDRVRVCMSVKALYECGADLEFEFLRVDRDGREEKLAIGEQDLVWARRVDRELRPVPLPLALRTALRSGPPSASDLLSSGSSDGAAAE